VIGLAGLAAADDTIRGHRLVSHSRSVDDLRRMSWQDFELLVAVAFRSSGYRADLTGRGADGGVDIILSRSGSNTLVQCKQNASRLGPGVVRELAGVMASEDATDGIVVACGGVGDEGQASQSATASGSSTGPPWLDSSSTWRYGKSSRSGQPPQRRRPCKIRLVHGATRRWSVAPPVMASSGAVAGSRVVEVLAHEKVAALISPNLRESRAHD
jgi:hypothetical protein